MPGDLVHLEGAPTVAGGRVFMGGGAAGVFCVELEQGHPRRQGTRPSPTIAEAAGREVEGAAGEVRGGQEEGPGLRRPAERGPAAQARPEDGLAEGRGQVARGRPGERRRRQGARRHVVPRQGEGRRAGAVLPERGDRRDGLDAAADAQPVGRGDAWRATLVIVPGSSVGYYYKRAQGREGRRDRVRPRDRQAEVAEGRARRRGRVRRRSPTAWRSAPRPTARCGRSSWPTASARWLYDAKMPLFAPPAVAGGVVYVGDLQRHGPRDRPEDRRREVDARPGARTRR